MNRSALKAKRHALFYIRLTQSSGVWIAVLLIHFFLWIVWNSGRDMPRSHRNKSTYLSVVFIALNDSVRMPHIVESGLKDVAKISTISPKQRSRELRSSEKTTESKKPSLRSADDDSPGKIIELDFDEMKRSALAITHEKPKRLLPGIDKKLSGAEKFADAIDHAKRGDCRSEYAYIGILAIPLLLKDTLTGEGCKW